MTLPKVTQLAGNEAGIAHVHLFDSTIQWKEFLYICDYMFPFPLLVES